MTDRDLLQRFIFENAPIRGEFIRLERCYQTIINQHQYPPSVRQLLGEALCVAGLLSAIIKFNGRLTVQFRGKGKLKLLLAQCDNHFHLRGLAKWDGDLSYEDLMEAFNHGILVIMLDPGHIKGRYQGIVSWRGNSLAESIEGYFRESEQLPTRIWLAVNNVAAAGFLLQAIPAADKTNLNIEREINDPRWEYIINETEKLYSDDMLEKDYHALLNQLYADEELRVFPPVPVTFLCTCSRKRGEDAILLLGREEAEKELKNKQTIVVTCDFCNKEYVFDPIDIAKIFEDRERPPNTHLH